MFLVGADGIGSVVRQAIGAEFDGITIPELFLTLSTTYDFREAMPDLSNISYLSDPRRMVRADPDGARLARAVSGRCRRSTTRMSRHRSAANGFCRARFRAASLMK